MIKVGDTKINVKHFPDRTQCLMDCDVNTLNHKYGYYMITWNYESDEELITLYYVVCHLRKTWAAAPIYLFMPYIPNARMDRVKNPGEVFTLKYFASILNSLHLDGVYVLDPHSDVSTALIDHIHVINPDDYIAKAIQSVKDKNGFEWDDDIMIYFPDAGAYKRYKDMDVLSAYEKIYGQKVREWKSGVITGLEIVDKDNKVFKKDLHDKIIIMIDDIISYGGTMYYSALKLKEFNPHKVYCYATHVEPDSFWNIEKGTFRKAMGFTNEDGSENEQIVEKLYTTNSIYNLDGNDFVIPIPLKTPIV